MAPSRTRSSNRAKGKGSQREVEPGSEEEAAALDSDALDDEEAFIATSARKRKRGLFQETKQSSPRKKALVKAAESDEASDGYEFDVRDGQEVVGRVVQAPRKGHVAPGQISQNTFDFLTSLQDPECNDRQWFKLHEPVYRLAEREWKDFVEEFTNLLIDVDSQIPHLPSRDVIHRIYRDIRFSNDKTPYKKCFSASFSRTGRKGVFAHFQPGGQSMIGAGSWCPGKNELATIRNNILRNSTPLRTVISAPEFVQYFGEATPHPKGLRRNVFGQDDELKVAPKGIDKNHKDISLLKCRSFAVVYRFSDQQVLAVSFKEELARMAEILRPFVHCMNDMMTLPDSGDESDGDDGDINNAGEAED